MAGTVLIFATILAGLSGFSSSWVISRFGTGPVVMMSCLLTATGMLVIGWASSGAAIFIAMIPLGVGAGAVDAGLNGFVARHYSGRHMNWLHACWGVGATLGPLLLGFAMTTGGGWRVGYWALGSLQILLAILFFASLSLWRQVSTGRAGESGADASAVPTRRANSGAGHASMAAFVLYVGVETMTGLWIGTLLIVGRGFDPGTASLCTAGFYGAITGGRILVGIVVDRHGNRRLIRLGLMTALAGSLCFLFASDPLAALLSLILVGGGFAPVYPCLMHEVPRRFAPDEVRKVIARQTGASYIGAATMPVAAGWFAAHAIGLLPWLTFGGTLLLAACIVALDRMTADA
ncbi:MAG TPA: MFS transporter, partial [Opitutales bacterium]|nr:MFS transporter [Opitutales bacterium]